MHRERVTVLEAASGGPGNYREVFSDRRFDYLVADSRPGSGAALALDDAGRFPLADGSMDIVIAGQVLERTECFWKLLDELVRVTHPDGLLVVIASSGGPARPAPVDCWRFYPDAIPALARYAGVASVDRWMDDKGPWNDVVGVLAHRLSAVDPALGLPALPVNRFAEARAVTPIDDSSWASGDAVLDAQMNAVGGHTPYLDVLGEIHRRLAPRRYLEIGVGQGRSLALVECPAVAVDPAPAVKQSVSPLHRLCRASSDAFFAEHADAALAQGPPDLAFIDGMHLFEYALRDFINVEQRAAPGTLAVIDDIFPNHPVQAERRRRSRVWTGDVWKLHRALATYRPDLLLLPLDTAPSGLLLVAGLDPANDTLLREYNPILETYVPLRLDRDADCIARNGALPPSHPRVGALLDALRHGRDDCAAALRKRLLSL